MQECWLLPPLTEQLGRTAPMCAPGLCQEARGFEKRIGEKQSGAPEALQGRPNGGLIEESKGHPWLLALFYFEVRRVSAGFTSYIPRVGSSGPTSGSHPCSRMISQAAGRLNACQDVWPRTDLLRMSPAVDAL